ncbi:MAG: hypothetical protein FWC16_04935 [Defluviitaleaceae bacterium]|nr:hypothetical protein [Defluviitaleaceae bacterium]MCL2274252.1 hypothetical protein [Defluviitaleaceae bacterium]
MVNGINSSIQSPQGVTPKLFSNRPIRGQGLVTNVPTPNVIEGVTVDISSVGRAKAQRLFEQMQTGSAELSTMRGQPAGEYNGGVELFFDSFSNVSREAWAGLGWGVHYNVTEGTWIGPGDFGNWFAASGSSSAELVVVAETAYRLIGAYQSGNKIFDFDGSDSHNFAALANSYAQMRASFIEQFSGEELENQLNILSKAFELSVISMANTRAFQTEMSLSNEHINIVTHNHLLAQGMNSPHFNGGPIDEFSRISDAIAENVRNAVSHFAHLSRQFVLENGTIHTEQDMAILEAFLQSAQPPAGQLSFSGLNTLREILHWRSTDNPANDFTPVKHRNAPIFDELFRAFPNFG